MWRMMRKLMGLCKYNEIIDSMQLIGRKNLEIIDEF